MTNKSLSMLAAAALLLTPAAKAQNLIPQPQSFTAGKGFFVAKDRGYKLVNKAGSVADNIYSAKWAAKAAANAKPTVLMQ